jgi:hypothetical protein
MPWPIEIGVRGSWSGRLLRRLGDEDEAKRCLEFSRGSSPLVISKGWPKRVKADRPSSTSLLVFGSNALGHSRNIVVDHSPYRAELLTPLSLKTFTMRHHYRRSVLFFRETRCHHSFPSAISKKMMSFSLSPSAHAKLSDEGAPRKCPHEGLRVNGLLQADTRHWIPNKWGERFTQVRGPR